MGEERSQDIIDMAIKVSSAMNLSVRGQEKDLSCRRFFFQQYNVINAKILAEFFSKVPNLKLLFDVAALTFEMYGYSSKITTPSSIRGRNEKA
jgi:hypothetical protein